MKGIGFSADKTTSCGKVSIKRFEDGGESWLGKDTFCCQFWDTNV